MVPEVADYAIIGFHFVSKGWTSSTPTTMLVVRNASKSVSVLSVSFH